jgi:hypothetical protein
MKTPRFKLRTLAHAVASTVVKAVLMFVALWAVAGCATTRPLTSTETVITDSTVLKQAQRLVAVSVPGDSAKITTRLSYDEATGLFRPVTIYSHSGRTRLAFTLDAYGFLQANAVTVPFVAQVPVTDTEITRTHKATKTTKTEVPVKAPLGRFVWFCIVFTVLAFVGAGLWLYTRFSNLSRFIK